MKDQAACTFHLDWKKFHLPDSGGSLGVWQTAGFDSGKAKIYIKIMDQGSGSIDIHE